MSLNFLGNEKVMTNSMRAIFLKAGKQSYQWPKQLRIQIGRNTSRNGNTASKRKAVSSCSSPSLDSAGLGGRVGVCNRVCFATIGFYLRHGRFSSCCQSSCILPTPLLQKSMRRVCLQRCRVRGILGSIFSSPLYLPSDLRLLQPPFVLELQRRQNHYIFLRRFHKCFL